MSTATPTIETPVATIKPQRPAEADSVPTRLPVHSKVEAEAVEIERAFVGVVKAGEVELRNAGAAVMFAEGDVTIERGGARDIISRGSVSLAQAGAGIVVAAGDARVSQGGAGALVSLGSLEIEKGGAGVLVAGRASVGQGGIVGLAIAPRFEVADGARVLAGPVVAVGAIVGIGLGFALATLIRAARA